MKNRKNHPRRRMPIGVLITFALLIAACLWMLPMTVGAAEGDTPTGTGTASDPYVVTTEAQLTTALGAAGGHIRLGAGITATANHTIASGKAVVLDLNGSTLDMGGNCVQNFGILELLNSQGSGSIIGTDYAVIENHGRFTLTSGTVSNGNSEKSNAALRNYDNNSTIACEMFINGGTVSGQGTGIIINGGTVTIAGGTVSGAGNSAIESNYACTLIVTGGNIESSSSTSLAIFDNGGTLQMTGGTVRGSGGIHTNGQATISGGTISLISSLSGITNNGTLTVSGDVIINAPEDYVGIGIVNIGTAYVQGGTITVTGSGILNSKFDTTSGIMKMSGGTVTGTIKTVDGTLADFLVPGYLYYDTNGAVITLTADQKELSGPVTVAPCTNHTGGTATCTTLAECELCGLAYGEYNENNHTDDDHDCVCDQCLDFTFPGTGTASDPYVVSTAAALTKALGAAGETVYIELGANTPAMGRCTIESGKTVHLDLNGYTLDVGTQDVHNKGALELLDSRGSGSIIGTGYAVIENRGHFTLTSGKVSYSLSDASISIQATIHNGTGGEVVINGGTVESNANGIYNASDSVAVRINGGTVSVSDDSYPAIQNESSLTVAGGTIAGGIKTNNTLAACLATGYVFYNESGAVITLTAEQKELSGPVTVAACTNHTGGTAGCTTLARCELCKGEYGTYYHADIAPTDGLCDECGKLPITEVNFPDAIFRGYIAANFDTDGDDLLSPEEIAAVTELDIQQLNITTLAGVEHFTNLVMLAANDINLTATTLDFSMLTKLKGINLSGAYHLTSLDVSGCTVLEDLLLSNCISLTALDLSSNSALYSLNVEHATALKSLDLSVHEKLNNIHITNTVLTSLKLHPNAKVKIHGYARLAIQHCGGSYVNLGNIVSDLSKIVIVENGTLTDGWLKLDEGKHDFMLYTATGNADAPLPIWVDVITVTPPAQHTYIAQPVCKDATQHYTHSCEVCREPEVTDPEKVAEHTFDDPETGKCACWYVCPHEVILNETAECARCAKKIYLSVKVNGVLHYLADVKAAFELARDGTAEHPATIKLLVDLCQNVLAQDELDRYVQEKVTMTGGVAILDLNGKKLQFYGDGTGDAYLKLDGARLTVVDPGTEKTGIIDFYVFSSVGIELKASQLTLEGGTLYASTTYALLLDERSTVIQDGGQIGDPSFTVDKIVMVDGTYVLNNGALYINYFSSLGDALTADSKIRIELNGGEVYADTLGGEFPSGYDIQINITGGSLSGFNGAPFKLVLPTSSYGALRGGTYPNGIARFGTAWIDFPAPGYGIFDENGNLLSPLKLMDSTNGPVTVKPVFEQISMTLGDDLAVNYFLPRSNLENPQMSFTLNDRTETVAGVLTSDGTQYRFVFDGVSPSCIGDTIRAELVGYGYAREYTVSAYLEELGKQSAADLGMTEGQHAALKTLIADLLVYGGAAQVFTGYKTDALVSANVTGSTFTDIPNSDFQRTTESGTGDITFTAATVYFDSVNALKFKLTATDLSGVHFTVKIDGGNESDILYAENGDGSYTITTEGIEAYRFDDVFTITAYRDGEKVASVTYSVKSYVYAKQSGNDSMAALARATYSYGLAAKAYQEAQNNSQ